MHEARGADVRVVSRGFGAVPRRGVHGAARGPAVRVRRVPGERRSAHLFRAAALRERRTSQNCGEQRRCSRGRLRRVGLRPHVLRQRLLRQQRPRPRLGRRRLALRRATRLAASPSSHRLRPRLSRRRRRRRRDSVVRVGGGAVGGVGGGAGAVGEQGIAGGRRVSDHVRGRRFQFPVRAGKVRDGAAGVPQPRRVARDADGRRGRDVAFQRRSAHVGSASDERSAGLSQRLQHPSARVVPRGDRAVPAGLARQDLRGSVRDSVGVDGADAAVGRRSPRPKLRHRERQILRPRRRHRHLFAAAPLPRHSAGRDSVEELRQARRLCRGPGSHALFQGRLHFRRWLVRHQQPTQQLRRRPTPRLLRRPAPRPPPRHRQRPPGRLPHVGRVFCERRRRRRRRRRHPQEEEDEEDEDHFNNNGEEQGARGAAGVGLRAGGLRGRVDRLARLGRSSVGQPRRQAYLPPLATQPHRSPLVVVLKKKKHAA
mmetsp:Transcript_3906/g.12103  ORF Transcript_3906/g.12103 Transcript_3906/m.12103 type:complete len:484 (-) Transcript_3906:773-2224(-)